MQLYCIMKVVKLYILLCSLFLSGSGESIHNYWRYRILDYQSHGHSLLSYKDKVIIELMVQTGNKTWISPTCIINTLNSLQYQFLCSQPGFHSINLQESNKSTEIIIPLDNTAHCYKWKATYKELKGRSKVLLSVWAGETAAEQSTKDVYITALFQSIGEIPSMTILQPPEPTVTELGFNSSCSCWNFQITLDFAPKSYEILLEISGRNIFAKDCTIRPLLSLISFEKFSDSSALEILTMTSSSIEHSPVLFQDKQTLGIAVVTYSGQNVITQDGFKTNAVFQISNVSGILDDIDFTTEAMVVLIDGEVFTVAATTPNVIKASGLPFAGVDHISARGTLVLPGIDMNDFVAAWSSFCSTEDKTIYISQDGGLNFQNITLPFGSAQSVAIHPYHDEVFVLVSLENGMIQVITYDILAQQWMLNSLTFRTSGGNVTIKFFPGGFGDILLWEETAVYYSANKGVTVNIMPVYTVNNRIFTQVLWEVDRIHIKQVSLGQNGEFVILSDENRLFYGNVVFGYALEIPSGVSPDLRSVTMFNNLGEVRLISFNGSVSEVYTIPTYSLILSILYPPPTCPFTRWSHNVRKSVYYLDSMDSLLLWISVSPRKGQSNELSFAISHQSAINLLLTDELNQTTVEGVVERNLSILLQPNLNVTHIYKMTAIRLFVTSVNFVCQSPAQTVALISVQCPPTRHIRIKRPSVNSCPEYDNYMYRIPRNAYDPELKGRPNVNGIVDKVIQYNNTLWGCPIKNTYTDTFKPILELYDGDEYITEVEADYVVWEVHGRKDFRYTSTAQQVGCHSANQLWGEMLHGGEHPSVAWTPHNYRHCFQESGGVLNGKAPYQILNRTGVSSLGWYGHNGVYVFTATVVANEYSFCNLTVTFAVEVYGATGNTYIGYIFLVLTCGVGVAVLVASFFYYRYLLKSMNQCDKRD